MMKTLDKGQDKLKKICDELRKETLEPAQKEAQTIIEQAKEQAKQLIDQAEEQVKKMKFAAKQEIEQEKNVFQSSLAQATKQGLEALCQSVENRLFNEQLQTTVQKGMVDPHLMAKLVEALIKAIEKEGFSTDFSAVIAKHISEKEVNSLITKETLNQLKEKSVVLGGFEGGVQIKLNDKSLTIDMSDVAIKELLARYVRKDFRKLVFAS